MNISIVGTGYMGLVTGTCFADLGATVTCVDTDRQKINRLVYGSIPIYEPGLEKAITTNSQPCTFVLKSTVPVGTALKVIDIIGQEIADRKVDLHFDVVSNPDFITEGNAIKDFLKPDRIIIGTEQPSAVDAMKRLYHTILHHNEYHVIYTDTRTAEMIKYAATSMLATRVSFMNEIANLCERVGADINTVRHGVGTDSRIGPKYIFPGCGYGGTLFPQDIKDLIKIGESNGCPMKVLQAVDDVNVHQKHILFKKLKEHFGDDLKDKTITLWGLSFKPETDDMREAPSIVTLNQLTEAGCDVRVYDPVAMNATKLRWDHVYCGIDMYDAVKGADALLILTEWRQFRIPAWDRVRKLMRNPLVIDGRNIYDPLELEQMGFTYRCIGR